MSHQFPRSEESTENEELYCFYCDSTFVNKEYLYQHVYHHIKQPIVKLERLPEELHPPLKITLKNRSGNSFEIVPSPVSSSTSSVEDTQQETYQNEAFATDTTEGFGGEVNTELETFNNTDTDQDTEEAEDRANVCFSPNFADVIGEPYLHDLDSPAVTAPQDTPRDQEPQINESQDQNTSDNTAGVDTLSHGDDATSSEYGSIPGAEPTPPPEPSPTGPTEYPKIKIKTTGLFKDPEPERCTITEITDDNPNGDPSLGLYPNHSTPIWTTPSLEDPLKLPEDNNLMSLFNNNDKAKDLGFSTSSDNEFISLDTYNERNRGTMQLYNPNQIVPTSSSSSSLDTLTGLPMQALAQQVSRLQPSSSQGLHQQNVLINIQQFPTPQQNSYQHPPMYPPHPYPPHPGQPPMHQPYQYQPPTPMYYPPAPGYPPQHPAPHMPPPPPQHQMGQMQPPPPMGQQPQIGAPGQPPNSMAPSTPGQHMPPNQMPQPPSPMQGGYRPNNMNQPKPLPPRGAPGGGPRMPGGPRGPMGQRAPMARPRAPMMRPRGGGQPMRGGVRPRMGAPQNGIRPQSSPVKRNPDQNSSIVKRKKLDVLSPSDKDDDDCQVICMQPKNTDGGLPQIESVHGGPESAENSIMHLSDSITLSVRNPPPKPVASPQKSDAKAVANILATRGITVTASAKPKEKDSPTKTPALPTALSLNGAVSIVASPKNNGASKSPQSEDLPTVDLTDDSAPPKPSPTKKGLPYRCDLCPAQYPNAVGLNKHRQTYHKTAGGMCELGVPLINLKQPGIMQKLSQLGINSYIPMPSAAPDGTYALPIINTKQPGNVAALGATQMLSLGPVRTIPRPAPPSGAPLKK
ncbi:pollen-specific leucine-rich repeat extensin-like protein 1 isoform X3 [Sitophilus oryzae]|uniref:Pollen-specific leucine-rich repeat extensin-like protein 1 isoform X3 n=1 Tax=Sitophilus oryzae TaxID=7048 RepID=A0A6J2XYR9_SITOR|nr:pollen-specific leucine-rich repeat extensin-like protein 1 isoform X3 [Sitophilus oryzae]